MYNKNKEIDSKSTLNFSENIKNPKTSGKLRVKRGNDETLVEATARGDYSHWLTQDDLIEIARVMYNSYANITGDKKFEILASLADLNNTLETFILKTKKLVESRLTLIIQLTHLRWVTLVISSKDKNYVAYYTDPKNVPLPQEYFQLLFDKFKIQTLSLSPGLQQQTEDYNCGLWALENAKQLNKMIDENQSIYWLIKQLQVSHNKEYFSNQREYLSDNLKTNPGWCERHPKFTSQFNLQAESQASSSFSHIFSSSTSGNAKRLKLMPSKEKEKITTLLEVFVESFMCTFSKDLGKYYLLAKGERLTEASLKNGLRIGLTGALLGAGVSQSLTGTIPSLVGSIRMISGPYYLSKDKAQKITKFFSEVKPGSLSKFLSAAAVDIFYSYENQFMMVTDIAGDRIAMEKLAEDAVGRVFNFISKYTGTNSIFSDDFITQGVIQGPSEKFFDPSVKSVRLRISGYILQDKKNHEQVNTVNLYEKVGFVVFKTEGQPNKYYGNKQHPRSHHYGYRRLLKWEQDANGELKDSLKEQFSEEQFPQKESVYQFISRGYDYFLKVEDRSTETQRILAKIKHRHSNQNFNRQTEPNKMPVLFDLRRSIKNFSGRAELLKSLHENLLSERTMAIVPNLAGLAVSESMAGSSSASSSSGSTFSISGLGGVGKTQLALRYAEIYAREYDFNVLWISAETQENLFHSFNKLANKLQLIITDSYGNKKDQEAIIDEVYEYFSDRKSLFIFDNVENYKAIENYLPKTMLDNFFPEKSDYLLIDEKGFLCGKNSSVINYIPLLCSDGKNIIQLNNINQIQGRTNQQEIFYLNKNIRKIDGGGGRNNEYPDTFFLSDRSFKSPSFILRNNTIILFLLNAGVGSVDYLIPLKEVGIAQVQFHSPQAIQHRFFFQTDIQNIQALHVMNSTITIVLNIPGFENTKTFNLTISNSSVASVNNPTNNTKNLANDISYLFQDTEMKFLNNAQVYLQEKGSNNKTITENINLFTELANRLEKTFSLQLFNHTMISIGRTKHEVFYINGLYESHLVGNGGENVYIILPSNDPEFPLAPITLYDTLREDDNELTELRDTLDFRELVKKYKQIYPDAIIFPQISRVAENLFLTLINAIYSPSHYLHDLESFHSLVTIQFKNAVLDNYTWYQKMDIFIDDAIPKNIEMLANEETEIWNLQEAPLVFTEDKEIIVITNKDIGEKAEIIIQKNIGHFIFLHNKKDLILTNMLNASSDICTIIFVDYKITEIKKKILSATLRFFDQELLLQDNQVKIEHASFFDFEKSENINDQLTSSTNLMNTTIPSVHPKRPPQQILHRRTRSQVHIEEETLAIIKKSVFKDENKLTNQSYFPQIKPKLSKAFDQDRILMMVEDYSKKHQDFALKNAASRTKKKLNKRNTKGQGSSLISAQHPLKLSTKSRTENLAVNKNSLNNHLQTFFPQSKPKLNKALDEDPILMITNDRSTKPPVFLSKNAASRVEKRLTQRNRIDQANSIAVQKKKSHLNLKNKHRAYTKINRNYDKQILNHSTPPIQKSPVELQIENVPVNKNNFLKNTFFQDKKNSFAVSTANDFLNHKEVFEPAIKPNRD